jgi:CubicO group peptidase (beta-lactamase class C family)
MPEIPEAMKLTNPWGLGWHLGVLTASRNYGDLVSPRMFGHSGATGTVVWADPDLDLTCAIFTTQPGAGRMLGRVSSAVAGAAE